MNPAINKIASGYFLTIDGNPYVKNGRTVFSRVEARGYKGSLTRKNPTRVVKMFSVHTMKNSL